MFFRFEDKRKKEKERNGKNSKETHDSKDNYLHRNRGIHDYSKIISVVATTFKLFFRFTKKKKKKKKEEKNKFKSWITRRDMIQRIIIYIEIGRLDQLLLNCFSFDLKVKEKEKRKE